MRRLGAGGNVSMFRIKYVGLLSPQLSANITRDLMNDDFNWYEEIIPGRVLATLWGNKHRSSVYINVHDFGFDADDKRHIRSRIMFLCSRAIRSPSNHSAWILGDFNFVNRNEFRCRVRTPDHPGTAGEGNRFWEKLLGAFTDLSPDDFTHLANDGQSLSRIDYVFTSLPAWQLAGTHMHAKVTDELATLAARRFSDHAPLIASIAFKASTNGITNKLSRL